MALVTGGSHDIGKAIALALGEAGAADQAIAINGGSLFREMVILRRCD